MIDTQLHILPGVDDGPETMEEALELARVLVQEGVHSAIATPHYNDKFPHYSAFEIRTRVGEMQQALNRCGIPLRLFVGHEALVQPGLIDDIQAGRLATLHGSCYLLLEFWNNTWLPGMERILFELRAYGIVPVLAHPERCAVIQREPYRLAGLIEQGVLAQLTASSLLGVDGREAQKCAEVLLKKGLIHCIASDAHSLRMRRPHVLRALQYATQLLDVRRVYAMAETWPAVILSNDESNVVLARQVQQAGYFVRTSG